MTKQKFMKVVDGQGLLIDMPIPLNVHSMAGSAYNGKTDKGNSIFEFRDRATIEAHAT